MTRRTREAALLLSSLLAGAALFVVACTSSSGTPPSVADAGDASDAGATTCPQDLPDACPNPPPSYQAEVQSIFAQRCFACHADGGVAAQKRDFSTYDKIFAQRSPILNQVYGCVMPPATAPQLTPSERAALLGWLVCRAPNN